MKEQLIRIMLEAVFEPDYVDKEMKNGYGREYDMAAEAADNMLKKFLIMPRKDVDKGEYIDELYCDNCDKDTTQKIYESGHERDSSQDMFVCLECGFTCYGLTGEYEDYSK